jgi:adenosine deaminase
MSATTMTDEFLIAHQALGFSWDQLCELTIMGFQSAFLPYKDKTALVAAVEAEIAAVPMDG